MKKRLLLTVCSLCTCATLLVPGLAVVHASADEATSSGVPNAILRSDTKAAPATDDLAHEWKYGEYDNAYSYTFRPEHGDTVFYTVSATDDEWNVGEEKDSFAVVYIGDAAMFYQVKDGAADSETHFRANSLNAYLKTLQAGKYLLNVSVPGGTAPDSHEHWWTGGGDVTCGASYSGSELKIRLTVKTYELTDSNVGKVGSSDPNVTVRYSIQTPEIPYTGEENNLPQTEITFDTSDEQITLAEGTDYTLSSASKNVGHASLTITGCGSFTGEVTIDGAYKIGKAENSVSDVYVVPWKYGEYDRNVNRFTANVAFGADDDLHFAIATDTTGSAESFVDDLDEIRLDDGLVSPHVAQLLNELDAGRTYYLYAITDGGDNYSAKRAYSQFKVVEVTNTWTTTPSVVSWEWHGFDENINMINAVPAFGDSVDFSIYTKNGDEYNAIPFGTSNSFTLEKDGDGYKLPANVSRVLAELDAGTYYLFASLISDTDNYTSINPTFSADALVPFRVLQARNYWTQIPKISNWHFGEYSAEVNAITASSAHGENDIRYRIYKQIGDEFGLINFGGTTSFTINAEGELPVVVVDGLKTLEVGKYYLRAEVAQTNNYTGLQETVTDFSALPAFEVLKAENYWSVAPSITAWAEGNYSNDDNLPVAAAHYGVVRIVIVDVNDEENVVYDSENNINKLSEAGVGAYLLTATVAGTENYGELTFDTIFRVFVPETAKVGIPWWLVLIIVICSLGVLVFIFWLLHDKGVLQMLTSKTIVAMRTKATMDATIAAVRANKVAKEAQESIKLAEEVERLEAEKAEAEEDDTDDDGEAILLERDEQTGFATFVRYQRPFSVKLIQASDEAKDYYSQLKNVLLSYKKMRSKLSKSYDAFTKGRAQIAKLVIRGKTLCLYLALDPDEYAETKYKVERSESKKFAEVPCLYRIKNTRRLGYAEELIATLCEKMGITHGENRNEDYRPPYESTEALLKKGMIKKIVYTRKISSVSGYRQVESLVAAQNEFNFARREVAASDTTATAAEAESAKQPEAEQNEPQATTDMNAATSENVAAEEATATEPVADKKPQTKKKTSRSKKNVEKK